MSNFIHNGMPVRAVARQMGITHSTVYARLRKYDLLVKTDDDRVVLNPTVTDCALSGCYDRSLKRLKKRPCRVVKNPEKAL